MKTIHQSNAELPRWRGGRLINKGPRRLWRPVTDSGFGKSDDRLWQINEPSAFDWFDDESWITRARSV